MRKKTIFRRILGWLLWLLAIVLVLFALQVTVLAFPQLIVQQSVQVGSVKLYYDDAGDAEMNQLAGDVDQRLRGSGFYDSTRTDRVFFFESHGLYSLFARLAMTPPQAQGFALLIFGNSFVSGPRVQQLADARPPYSIWEGNPAHTIAHEIGHQYMADRIGRSVWKQLPHWKQEGFPEYLANIGVIREDSQATLPSRIGVLNDLSRWGGEHAWDRIHYEAGLLVEYLLDIRGYGIEDIVADSVTKDETLAALSTWSAAQVK